MTAPVRWLLGLLAATLLAAGAVFWIDRMPDLAPHQPEAVTPAVLERGAQLARAGNCMACHTERGGPVYAGGRSINTPFGAVYSSNLTPDAASGLGLWSADDFWRALHHGIGRDGRRLSPAFPYTEFTRINRSDSDALYAWLRTLDPVDKAHRPHELARPFGTPWALAAWRALFFRPGTWQDEPSRSAEWNRGAYLVNGAGHCVSCHGGRNMLGGQWRGGFGGGLLASSTWYAPSLERADEASVAHWPLDEIVALLRDGVAPQGRVSGPMAEVVRHGTRHLAETDLRAMAVYLQSLPQQPAPIAASKPSVTNNTQHDRGKALYGDHCAGCHGKAGEGGITAQGRVAVPALAGNRLLALEPAVNLLRVIALGGFGVESGAQPQPFSMPGFAHMLSDQDIADIACYLRGTWTGLPCNISTLDVSRSRGGAE